MSVKINKLEIENVKRVKAVKMERGIMVFAVFHRRQKLRILKEVPVLDGFRDPGQLLIHNAAGAHI